MFSHIILLVIRHQHDTSNQTRYLNLIAKQVTKISSWEKSIEKIFFKIDFFFYLIINKTRYGQSWN